MVFNHLKTEYLAFWNNPIVPLLHCIVLTAPILLLTDSNQSVFYDYLMACVCLATTGVTWLQVIQIVIVPADVIRSPRTVSPIWHHTSATARVEGRTALPLELAERDR